MKRYVITDSLRTTIKSNASNLSNVESIRTRVKNLIYRNKSVRERDLSVICKYLKLEERKLQLKEADFYPECNFGYLPTKIEFAGVNENFAELIGIILGDGNLCNNTIKVILDSREDRYKSYVKELFFSLFNCHLSELKVPNKNAIVLYKSNKTIMNILSRYGLKTGNKLTNKVRIPTWIKKDRLLLKWCIRGLMNTDGTVSFDNRDRKVLIGFCNYSVGLLKDMAASITKFGIKVAKCGPNQIRINRKVDVGLYAELIGFSNYKYIQRYNEFINRA